VAANFDDLNLTDLAENTPAGPEWDAWLVAHPDTATELEIARRVRLFMTVLREASIAVPADFEARLMERVRADRTLLDLLDLGLVGMGRALIEILNVLFGILPTTQPVLAYPNQ
jgi:hypothetical protein